MMKMNQKIRCVFVCSACIMLLSACSSIPFLGDSEEPQSNAVITSRDNERAALESEIEDFKSMKSSLNRLVSLESDLSFLLDEMTRFNEKNPILYDTASSDSPSDQAGQSEIVYSASGKTERTVENTADGWAKSQGRMADKWSSQAEEMDMLRIGQTSLSQARGNDNRRQTEIVQPAIDNGMDTSKFSGSGSVEVAAATPVLKMSAPSPTSSPESNLDKFSYATNPKQIVGDVDNCSDWKVDSVKNYSLHLASYTTRKSAQEGWSKLDDKYADMWCKTEAKLAKVVVKGNEYLSLRVGGYDSKDKVMQLCSMVKSRGDYCAVSTAEGELIQ